MSRARWSLIGVLAAVAVGLRLYGLNRLPGLNADETWFGSQMLRWAQGLDFQHRTPTGNSLSPFHSGLVAFFHLLLGPSIWALRLPAVLSGCAAIAASAWLLRRRGWLGLLGSLAFGASPILVAYSRVGWDTEQVALFSVLIAGFALAGNLPGTVLSLWGGLVVHPTFVFLTPLALGPFAAARWRQEGRASVRGWSFVALTFAIGFLVWFQSAPGYRPTGQSLPKDRVLDLGLWWQFLAYLARDWGGSAPAEQLTVAPPLVFDVACSLAASAAVVLPCLAWLRASASPARWGAIGGWVAGAVGYLAVAGPEWMTAGVDRYALPLVASALWMAVVATLDWAGAQSSRAGIVQAGFIAYFAWGTTTAISFFFIPWLTPGVTTHRIWRVGDPDPKLAAARKVAESLALGDLVVAEDWWIQQPIQYGLLEAGRREVVRDFSHDKRVLESVSREGGLVAGFAGGELDRILLGSAVPREEFADSDGKPLIRVWSFQRREGLLGR